MKERLDVLLVKRNLAESREKAKALIMSGIVYVNGQKEDKAGTTFEETAPIEVRGSTLKYVSRAYPDLEAKKLLETVRAITVQEAADRVGISRSSFYKYKDDIFPFYAGKKGRSITFVIEVDDQPGVMASILNIFALYKANILTIHQSIPINGKGLLTVSVDIEDSETDVSAMIQDVEKIEDVSYVKIIAME